MSLKKGKIILLLFFLFVLSPFFASASSNSIVRGEVIDQDNNLVTGAILKFDCLDVSKVNYPDKTDDFGTFRVENFPTGDCEIFAQANDFIGSSIVHVEQEKSSKIIIKLNQKVVKSNNWFFLLIFLFLILLGIIAYATYHLLKAFMHQKKDELKKETNNKIHLESKKIKNYIETKNDLEIKKEIKKDNYKKIETLSSPAFIQSKRLATIFVALSKTEKQVVIYLQEQSGKATQAAIRHGTYLPRTTLGRTLQSLEQKKIIIVEKEGKAVKVTFTPWILENE